MKKSVFFIIFLLLILVLLALFNVKPEDYNENMLLQALENGNTAKAEKLLNKINDPDITAVDGSTPLIIAAKKGYNNFIVKLINKGADINKRNYDGYDAVMQAVQSNNISTLKLLLKYGPKFKSILEGGDTAFTLAAKNNNAPALKLLLNAIRDYRGASEYVISLHLGKTIQTAAQNGDINTINVILSSLGDHKISLIEAFTAINIAMDNGRPEIANLIASNEEDLYFQDKRAASAVLLESAKRGYFRLITALIKNKADVNYQNPQGITPLMAAAQGGWDYSAKMLLENGADKNLKSEDDLTAADYARSNGHEDLAKDIENFRPNNGPTLNSQNKA